MNGCIHLVLLVTHQRKHAVVPFNSFAVRSRLTCQCCLWYVVGGMMSSSLLISCSGVHAWYVEKLTFKQLRIEIQRLNCGAGANASAAGSVAGNTPPHMSHTPRLDPSSSGAAAGMSHQASAQGKGRGQNPKAGRAHGQGSANSPVSNPPMQILQPPPRSALFAIFTSAAMSIANSKLAPVLLTCAVASAVAVMLSLFKSKILSTSLVLALELCHSVELWRLFSGCVCAVYRSSIGPVLGKVHFQPTQSQ